MISARPCEWCEGPLPTRPPGVGGNPRRTCSQACRNAMNYAMRDEHAHQARLTRKREAYRLAVASGLQPSTAATFGSPDAVRRFLSLSSSTGVDFASGSKR